MTLVVISKTYIFRLYRLLTNITETTHFIRCQPHIDSPPFLQGSASYQRADSRFVNCSRGPLFGLSDMLSALSSLKPRAEFVHSGLVMADEVGHESEGMSGIQLPDMSGKSKKVQ